MSAPLDFLKEFAAKLREAGISFAITSGMACVHYGFQQTTKDSDWIIPAEDLEKLRALFTQLEGQTPGWRISYRQICGAPLEEMFMEHGWTSHISVCDGISSFENKVDIFSKPPRLQKDEICADADGWASRHAVAQMKKTDRDKDWPILKGLAQSLHLSGEPEAVLHLMAYEPLVEAWKRLDAGTKAAMARRRPLLRAFASEQPLTKGRIDLLFMLERLVWEKVNEHRYSRYTRAWRSFYRQWRAENPGWPSVEPFAAQHAKLFEAALRLGLPKDPLPETQREEVVKAAVEEILAMERFTEEDIAQVLPPVYELLP